MAAHDGAGRAPGSGRAVLLLQMPLSPEKVANVRASLIEAKPLKPARDAVRRGLRVTYRTPRPVLIDRQELGVLLNQRRLLGTGYEVGVKEGGFSELLLEAWRGSQLIGVDPWLEAAPEEYVDLANVDQATHEVFYERARARLSRFGDRSTLWRMKSVEGAAKVLPHSADFVYIDARHDYDSVIEDLEAWYDRVRPGGLLAGHDYVDGTFEDGEFGVRSAVDEFFARRNLPVHHTVIDQPWVSWFVLVPAVAPAGR
jgi:hypothetical protein